ncbi:MAG: SDR family NAD(P)-dependent oxidoreductase, partial [Rhodobacteraceae bacterium]|nr:SDR family NAD(P)-dependent oxidoreductase [Paracoccaceae bacterium]
IYISSTAGQVGAPTMAPYCASKHGLIGLMRSVAWDIGAHNATANAICPGWVRTTMAEEDARIEATAGGMDPEEIADTVSYLASDAASGVNGEALTVALGGLW